MKFNQLGLSDPILKAINDLGYNEATYIQSSCIPIILNDADVLGQSQTGTGKTAAFGLPIIDKIEKSEGKRKVQALILSPTRELALQVSDEFRKFTKYKDGIKVITIYGGTPFVEQIKNIKNGTEIIVGCPGRILDHLDKKILKLDECKMLVLDEADEMLNMGFREDIEKIISYIPEERQTLLFSATMPQAIKEITKNYQKNPIFIKNPETKLTSSKISQIAYECAQKDKQKALIQMIELRRPKMAMVFCNTKKMVDDLTAEIITLGYPASAIHGDMKQEARANVMERFKRGQINYLICTDVAARGIDVNNMDVVINYDLPQDNEYYVHRIGRTGRAGKEGLAITLFTPRERNELKDLERITKAPIDIRSLPTKEMIDEIRAYQIMHELTESIDIKTNKQLDAMVDELLERENFDEKSLLLALVTKFYGSTMLEAIDAPVQSNSMKSKSSRKTTISIGLGRKDGISVAHIVSGVSEATGIVSKDIGKIIINDTNTTVQIPEDLQDVIIDKLKDTKIKGKKFNVELFTSVDTRSRRSDSGRSSGSRKSSDSRRSDSGRSDSGRRPRKDSDSKKEFGSRKESGSKRDSGSRRDSDSKKEFGSKRDSSPKKDYGSKKESSSRKDFPKKERTSKTDSSRKESPRKRK